MKCEHQKENLRQVGKILNLIKNKVPDSCQNKGRSVSVTIAKRPWIRNTGSTAFLSSRSGFKPNAFPDTGKKNEYRFEVKVIIQMALMVSEICFSFLYITHFFIDGSGAYLFGVRTYRTDSNAGD